MSTQTDLADWHGLSSRDLWHRIYAVMRFCGPFDDGQEEFCRQMAGESGYSRLGGATASHAATLVRRRGSYYSQLEQDTSDVE